ncbi:MAG: hypothetical protein LQ347_004593 [Umbilicaria vellea]|nr:MAG: hypothetical protein LQ347_004593 [Umbilicaria vellea]
MSRIKGIFPLFLATTFGIFNGIAVFGPEFRKQGQEKLGEQHQNEVAHVPDPTAIETLKEAETEAIGAGATQRLDKPEQSWWSITRLWEQAKSEEERREAAERDILEQNYQTMENGQDGSISSGSASKHKRLAKKFYGASFREFPLLDLSRLQYRRVALRWRAKAEVLIGTGHSRVRLSRAAATIT